jgi:hypothetical protein
MWAASAGRHLSLSPWTHPGHCCNHHGFLRRNCKICAMNRAPALNFVSPRSMPSGAEGEGGREGGRERDPSEREREAERKKEQGQATWSPTVASRRNPTLQTHKQAERQRERGAGRQAGRPNPWSASKAQVSCLAAAAAAELYSLLEAFSWTNVAAGCVQLGGEASHVSSPPFPSFSLYLSFPLRWFFRFLNNLLGLHIVHYMQQRSSAFQGARGWGLWRLKHFLSKIWLNNSLSLSLSLSLAPEIRVFSILHWSSLLCTLQREIWVNEAFQ